MDELFAGIDWVERFEWELTGTSPESDVTFSLGCPRDAGLLIGAILGAETREGTLRGTARLKEDLLARVGLIVERGLLSTDALARLFGCDVDTVEGLVRGEDRELPAACVPQLLRIVERLEP